HCGEAAAAMTTAPPDEPADFTASDILSADAWTGRAPKPVLGIDVVCTKIAVDFQNMRRDSVEECVARNLELLRSATACDCAFLAPLNPEDSTIGEVKLARSAFAQCRPEGLTGIALASLPWLKGRLEHLRLSELRDTSAPRKEQAIEAAKLAELHIGSTLLVALRVQGKPAGFLGLAHTMPRGAWDLKLQPLMTLVGTSRPTGPARPRSARARIACATATASGAGSSAARPRASTSTGGCCAWWESSSTSPSASSTRRRCSARRRAPRSPCSRSATASSPPTPTRPSTTSTRWPRS